MGDNKQQETQPVRNKSKRNFGLFGFRKKKLSKEDVVKTNAAFLTGMLNRAVKTLDSMEKAGRIPDKVASHDKTKREVNRAGIREFCKNFRKAHDEHVQRMKDMNARRQKEGANIDTSGKKDPSNKMKR